MMTHRQKWIGVYSVLIMLGCLAASAESQHSTDEFYRKSWAVVIGINAYQHWPQLEYAVNDARSVSQTLQAQGFEVWYLENEQATRARITRLLWDELPLHVQREDRVLIFFSGHGETEQINDSQKMGYLIPVDADPSFRSSAISMDWIRDVSAKLQAKHILYVVDACYSGLGLHNTRSLPIAKSIPSDYYEYVKKLTQKRTVQMITAGGQDETVVEENGSGLFTRYFLEALDGSVEHLADDGFVTAGELGVYLQKAVSVSSHNRQTPQYGFLESGGDFVFVLDSKQATAPTPRRPPAAPRPPSAEALTKILDDFKLNCQTYNDLIEQEQQGAAVEPEIMRTLINLIEDTRTLEDMLRLLPSSPQVLERLRQVERLRADFEQELARRRSTVQE
jgi:hypothetical protein